MYIPLYVCGVPVCGCVECVYVLRVCMYACWQGAAYSVHVDEQHFHRPPHADFMQVAAAPARQLQDGGTLSSEANLLKHSGHANED